MRNRFAPYVVGAGLLALAAALIPFAVFEVFVSEPWWGFAIPAAAAAALGYPLVRIGSPTADPGRREAILGVLLLWLAMPFFGAAPYVLAGGVGPIDALFEAMSGFTATGATALTDFTALSNALFMWRALTQWIGGVGIIVLFIAVFPKLAIAGRQMFFAEAPGPSDEKLTPRLRSTAGAVLLVYVALTVLCGSAYRLAGMSWFDAVAHTFTTVSAAGFSPEARSFEAFANPTIHWVAIVFMLLAGVNFALQYRALSGRPLALARDAELRAYLAIIAVAGTALTLLLLPTYGGADALRHGFFQTLSILTTTGYATVDFGVWDPRAQTVLVVLMFIGGSAGSAAGGIKIIRWLVIARHTVREVRRSIQPRAVLLVRVGDKVIPEDVLRSVAAFLTLFVALFAMSTVVLVLLGADFVTAFTASIATVGNVGPGLGLVGPMASYADLHPVSRLLLTFNMYAGRLEILTVFVLFTPDWWASSLRRGR